MGHRVWLDGAEHATDVTESKDELMGWFQQYQDAGIEVLYVENMEMKPAIDQFIQALSIGLYIEAQVNHVRVHIHELNGVYYVGGVVSTELDVRRSIQCHYALHREEWEEDVSYIGKWLEDRKHLL